MGNHKKDFLEMPLIVSNSLFGLPCMSLCDVFISKGKIYYRLEAVCQGTNFGGKNPLLRLCVAAMNLTKLLIVAKQSFDEPTRNSKR